MKILNYKLLTESLIDDLIKSDQKQSDLLNSLSFKGNNTYTKPNKEKNNESINGLYQISFLYKDKENDPLTGEFNLSISNNDTINLTNKTDTIKIKFLQRFNSLSDLINKRLPVTYIKGNKFDLKNVNIKFLKINKKS
jgi:hypothetical protein